MFSARKKISKEKGADPDTFEESVAQVTEELPFGGCGLVAPHMNTASGLSVYYDARQLPKEISSRGKRHHQN